MKEKLLFFLTALFLYLSLSAQLQMDDREVDSVLAKLPGVKILTKTISYAPYQLKYLLTVKQPVDHQNPAAGYLYQQVRLVHRGFQKAMVMETEGYRGFEGGAELEKMLQCNYMNIEFRYFNKSIPDSLNWNYLTFEQATADLHHINQLFRSLYASKWISTGISRGGETALTYKYFYPDDVDLVVPYVAPLPNDIADKRTYAFLDTAGGRATVQKMRNVQLFLLKHEQAILRRLPLWQTQLHYTTVGGIGAAFEYAVLEYPFSFWQISNIKVADIPTNNDLDTYLKHFLATYGKDEISFFSDENGVADVIPHYYMTYQTGYYGDDARPFTKYLHYLHGPIVTGVLLPANIPHKPYEPAFQKKIINWLATKGNDILYIYGGRDTWTACKPTYEKGVNAKTFIIPGANHFDARIKNMPAAMHAEFISSLEAMSGLKVEHKL